MDFDRTKFKALVHYIIWKAGKSDWFGATKLNKVLWFSDARAHMLLKSSITGERYIREKFGPVPRHIMPILEELSREGSISIKRGGDHTRFMATARPAIEMFSKKELEIVDWWASNIAKNHTAGSISEETHDYAWEIARMGEELPLYAYRVSRFKDPDGSDLLRLRKRAKALGLP